MKDKHRGLYFLAITLSVGVIILLSMWLFSSDSNDRLNSIVAGKSATGTIGNNNTYKPLEDKINQLNEYSISPADYNALITEINSSYQQGLFNEKIKTMLVTELNNTYQDLSYKKMNSMMGADPIDDANLEIMLNYMEVTFGKNSTIDQYKNQVKLIKYYSNGLPLKVNAFINAGFMSFNENEYNALMKSWETLPGLNEVYRNRNSIVSARNLSIQNLRDFYQKYAEWELSVSGNSSSND